METWRWADEDEETRARLEYQRAVLSGTWIYNTMGGACWKDNGELEVGKAGRRVKGTENQVARERKVPNFARLRGR